jgi:hypothetical protein
MLLLKSFIAFLIAGGMAWVELVTSKYPRTIELLWKRSRALWVYAFIYGLISFGFTLAYVPLTQTGILHLQVPSAGTAPAPGALQQSQGGKAAGSPGDKTRSKNGSVDPSFLIAVLIGLSAKALLHITFISIPGPGSKQPFPVGTETLVQVFEPWLLQKIGLDADEAVRAYLKTKVLAYPNLDEVKKTVIENIPSSLPGPEKTALEHDVGKATTVSKVLELYLTAVGVSIVEQSFPSSAT